jgi:hypothetical protein
MCVIDRSCVTGEYTRGPRRSLPLTAEGTPLIYTRSGRAYDQYTQIYRTLDGVPATIQRGELLGERGFQATVETPGLWHLPVAWNYRIAGISDFGQPPIGWYLIRDDQPLGHAYLVGYDLKSKQFVGTIGRNGLWRRKL